MVRRTLKLKLMADEMGPYKYFDNLLKIFDFCKREQLQYNYICYTAIWS